MPKKNQDSRLNALFSNLIKLSDESTAGGADTLPQSFQWETDLEGRFVKCGRDVAELMGVYPEQLTGKSLLGMDFVKEDRSTLGSIFKHGKYPVEAELHFQSAKTEYRAIRCTFSAVLDEKGQLSSVKGEALPVNDGYEAQSESTSLDDFLSEHFDEAAAIQKSPETAKTSPQKVDTGKLQIPDDSDLEMPRMDSKVNPMPDLKPLPARKIHKQTGSFGQQKPAIDESKSLSSASDSFKLAKTAPLGPLPGLGASTMIDGIAIKTEPIAGVSFSNDKFQSAENVWTQEALNSFNSNSVISNEAYQDTPAVLASPLSVRNEKAGVIELVDVSPERVWTEDDRLLLEEVTKQLGLALENAQLYSAVRKELTERVKAEEETLRRNRDLATLNTIGQRLSSLVSREQIYAILSNSIQQMLNTQNLLITLIDRETNMLSFPVCVMNNETIMLPDRPFSHGYQEIILNKRAPVLIQSDAAQALSDSALDHPGGIPQSLLAVPLLAGDRSIGVISVFDFSKEFAFDQIQQELLSTIASQTATSLENANLFAEIRHALEIIEVRERFQMNVTQAVATLSEHGVAATPEVLEFLSKASLCQRVYYAVQDADSKNEPIWRVVSLYETPALQKKVNLPRPEFVPIGQFANWQKSLSGNGWHAAVISSTGPSSPEQEFLKKHNAQSLLLLSIPSQDKQIGFIAFENHTEAHVWAQDEISVLRIASDAYTNTLIREGLLSQLKTSLDETESLYSASHKLALANNMPEMITAVISGESVQEINRGVLVLFTYDENGQLVRMNVEANYHSGAGTPPPPAGTEYLRDLYEPIFIREDSGFYNDITTAQIDQGLREILLRQNILAMAVLPLWSSNKQIGVFLLQSSLKHEFTDQEIRTFPPLVDQMSTAIENLQLFERTQEALSETELLYKVSSGISNAVDLHDLVKLVGESAMPKNADQLLLFVAPGRVQNRTGELDIVGCYTSQGKYYKANERVPFEAFDFIDFDNGEPFVYNNLNKSSITPDQQKVFSRLGFISGCFVPLQSAGATIGVLASGATKPVDYRNDDIHLLQVVGNSITVAIERQRLLNEAQRRAIELQAAAEIARDTTSTLSLETLLARIVTLLKDRFGFYHCSIFLMDETGTYAQVKESTGRAGEELKKHNHQLAVGSKSVIGNTTASGNPVVVNDVRYSPIYYPNPLLPDTRSEMAIPLKIAGKVIGALDIQSKRASAFTQDELSVLQILSDQIAVAIENARAYEMSQKAVSEMQELDRVKSQFLANMSHELRTPLNSVIGFSRVILKGIDGPINDVQEQDINAIYKSGMHLLTMINEILDLSKIDAGKMELQLEPINLSDIVNSVISSTSGLVKEKSIELIQKIPATLPRLMMDETRISQVLINLISNAVKFTEKGSITVEAKITENPFGKKEVLVTVTDTGIGIAPADQVKLFQRFSQVDDSPTRKTGGTGLGLSISRSLIEMHGGQIGLMSSEVGKGSVFYFTLPLPEVKRPVDQDQLKHGENVILAIDDDAEVIELYERFLEPNGYKVVPLTDPDMAVAKAIELKPFAITLDIMMPQKDGWQLINELKENEQTRNIPILVCSILEEEEKGFSMGASDYLVKPFAADDLANAIFRLDRDNNFREVLVIDDDEDDLHLVQKMLEQGGKVHATLAKSGQAGLDALKRLTPDIILLDLFMQGMNGFEVLERLRSEMRLSRIPVIILTGVDLTSEQRKQLKDYGPQMITKSTLREEELLTELDAALKKYKTSSMS